MRTKHTICVAHVLLALVLLSARSDAQAGHHSHLPALSSFDKAAVQTLVDTIETDHNASTLEFGYFMRRGEPPLPPADGYNLVAAAADKEPVASRRWFLLESVRAFAAFRVQGVSPDEGFKAYDTLFSHAAEAQKADATEALRQAILFYVFSVPGRFVDLSLLSDDRTGTLLLKAWTAYTAYVPPGKPGIPEPLWAAAIQKSSMQTKFLPAIDKTLKDPAAPKTYGLLKTAAVVYQQTSLTRAINLLQQAKPLLPSDKTEMHWYYSTLVNWLSDAKKYPQAISAAQEEIKATGQGQGMLAQLQYKSGDLAGLKTTLAALSAPDASQIELNNAADWMDDLYSKDHVKNKDLGDQVITMLSQYVSSPRSRDIEQELRARKSLADLLIQQSKFAEAKAVLTAGHYTLPLPTAGANDYYLSLQQILAELNPQKNNMGGNSQK